MASISGMVQWAINTCNAPNIGYSQEYRDQQTVNGITYYDCSSFIWYALKDGGGFDVVTANGGNTWPFTTYTMENVLIALGFSKGDACAVQWTQGDIVTSMDHCEIVYEDVGVVGQGRTMGAHSGDPTPLDDQVSINDFITTCSYFPTIYRFGGAPLPPLPPLPGGRPKKGLKVWQMIRYHF